LHSTNFPPDADRYGARLQEGWTIGMPTLVLVGANDTNFLAATDQIAAKIPGSTKVMISDASHGANLHQPSAFNRAMDMFPAGLAH
jgi:pimeloyl-ACP methyl ester carboxylesterase